MCASRYIIIIHNVMSIISCGTHPKNVSLLSALTEEVGHGHVESYGFSMELPLQK